MTETTETRLRRLRMRSWRRGMKEMDLILGHFSDSALATLPEDQIAAYEALLSQSDQDLYLWITRRITGADHPERGPAELGPILDRVATHAVGRLAGEGS